MLGIVKAYTTRVGAGPFPTELENEIGERLGVRGHEFGTVTGRKRRCGWFDAVLVRQAAAVSGITGIALTKLDVLDGFESLSICTGYRIGGRTFDYLPPHWRDQAAVEPIYETIEGWSGSTAGARSWADLPAQAIKYIRRVEELILVPCGARVNESGARGYDPGPRSVRGLIGLPHAGALSDLAQWPVTPVVPMLPPAPVEPLVPIEPPVRVDDDAPTKPLVPVVLVPVVLLPVALPRWTARRCRAGRRGADTGAARADGCTHIGAHAGRAGRAVAGAAARRGADGFRSSDPIEPIAPAPIEPVVVDPTLLPLPVVELPDVDDAAEPAEPPTCA